MLPVQILCRVDATDTDTVGGGEINVHVPGALAVKRNLLYLPLVYDALIAGSDNLMSMLYRPVRRLKLRNFMCLTMRKRGC